MTDRLFLSFKSAISERNAIVSDEGESVWFYLTASASLRPERDCWLLNAPSAPLEPDVASYRGSGGPPPAPATFVDPQGVRDTPGPEHWHVQWSTDGHAAAILLDKLPIVGDDRKDTETSPVASNAIDATQPIRSSQDTERLDQASS